MGVHGGPALHPPRRAPIRLGVAGELGGGGGAALLPRLLSSHSTTSSSLTAAVRGRVKAASKGRSVNLLLLLAFLFFKKLGLICIYLVSYQFFINR